MRQADALAEFKHQVAQQYRQFRVDQLTLARRKMYDEFGRKRAWFLFLNTRTRVTKGLMRTKEGREAIRTGEPRAEDLREGVMILRTDSKYRGRQGFVEGGQMLKEIEGYPGETFFEKLKNLLTLEGDPNWEKEEGLTGLANALAGDWGLQYYPLRGWEQTEYRALAGSARIYLRIEDRVSAFRAVLAEALDELPPDRIPRRAEVIER